MLISPTRNAGSSIPEAPSQGTIWIPPLDPYVKVNVDIKFSSPDERFGACYICRDTKGMFISAGTCSGSAGSSEQAECAGILSAVQWAAKQGLKCIELETDGRAVVEFLNGNAANISWVSTNLLNEASDSLKNFELSSVKFCNRLGNYVAHTLAQQVNVAYLYPIQYSNVPSLLSAQLNKDRLFCNISDS
ncbi:hypothetical protein FRX31_004670 [Thalictrum thalictroides]|uniref:RNase H type-1 domain-containing protein n=1 Tax=Thalictrum thalictroides TaxID=46969 RepID=A0A7J6XBJ9_THATH|nr:hypothetical protein FRX31_004670 [Thalictrum thalictroides]